MAVITAIKLTISGVTVKAPKVNGITRKLEKVWSKNTGRTATAKMQGTILAIKKTLSIQWGPLTQNEQELIESVVSDSNLAFTTVEITKPDGTTEKLECYFGTPTFEQYEIIGGQWRCKSGKVDAIER